MKSNTYATLKGFTDHLPPSAYQRKQCIQLLGSIFEKMGFLPIETPALEYLSTLLVKTQGEISQQIYSFHDNGQREVALRFDLTLPLMRFILNHKHHIAFPFKIYHIGKVWRGEKPQKGRLREFTQCDVDIIGGDPSITLWELWLTLIKTLRTSLTHHPFSIHFSHLQMWDYLFPEPHDNKANLFLLIDKYYKIPHDIFYRELHSLFSSLPSPWNKEKLLSILQNNPQEFINHLISDPPSLKIQHSSPFLEWKKNWLKLEKNIQSMQLHSYLKFDPFIIRGLNYYRDVVFETFMHDDSSYQSIASGGQYPNLLEAYGLKEAYPGIGFSIGLERILPYYSCPTPHSPQILILCLNRDNYYYYHTMRDYLLSYQYHALIYLSAASLKQQYKYAEIFAIPWVLSIQIDKTPCFELKKINTHTIYSCQEKEEILSILNKEK